MIAPFQNRYRMAWPFDQPSTFVSIDTSEDFPVWSVPSNWKFAPARVCDLLTANEFNFSFEFSSAAFNAEFGEDFPENVSYSVVCESGTWKYYDTATELETFNLDYKWDTQAKLFERYIDPDEESEFFNPNGLSGIRYRKVFEPTLSDNYWVFDITMVAQIPIFSKDQDQNFVWIIPQNLPAVSISIGRGNSIGIFDTFFDASNAGFSYSSVDHRGGPGEGFGGSFTDLSISIATHFPA